MELLLNLVWLTLAVLALVANWSMPRPARMTGPVYHRRGLLLAACLLALVFPVVSVSDDLTALRAEMEECGYSSAGLKKVTRSNLPIPGNDNSALANAGTIALVRPTREPEEKLSEFRCAFTEQASAEILRCRAPPYPES
jgi:hypothetical protein